MNGTFSDDFRGSYPMQSVVFGIGDTVIRGVFKGSNQEINGLLHISGSVEFKLSDVFRDPLDIGTFIPEYLAKIDEHIAEAVSEATLKIADI